MLQVPRALYILVAGQLAQDAIHATSPAGHQLVTLSAGYFLYDLGQVLFRWEQEGPAFLAHALACLSVYSYATLSGSLQYYGEQ